MLTQLIDPLIEEVARAATNALRSIEFDDHAEAAAPVNVITDAAFWKVSADTEASSIIENILMMWFLLLPRGTKRRKPIRCIGQSGEYAQRAGNGVIAS